MKSFRQSDYRRFSEEEIIHQALAVWEEEDPPRNKSRLLKAGLGEENTRRLEDDRKTFVLNVKNERFMVCSLVRVQGKVAGYITDTLGIIDIDDRRDGIEEGKVFFHSDDVIIYKKSVRSERRNCQQNLMMNNFLKSCSGTDGVTARDYCQWEPRSQWTPGGST